MKLIHDNRKNKKAWSFNIKTRELRGETEVQPDPNDVNNWITPRGVTLSEPPKEKKGYVNFWNGEKWEAKKA